MNVARAFAAALIGTVQTFFEPRQAPLQDLSFHPFAGDAVSRTGEYETTLAEQRSGQPMPAELRTAPFPVTATVRRNVAGAKSADRVVRLIIETYLAPNKTFRDVPEILDNEAMDPLRDFSNACREELRKLESP